MTSEDLVGTEGVMAKVAEAEVGTEGVMVDVIAVVAAGVVGVGAEAAVGGDWMPLIPMLSHH